MAEGELTRMRRRFGVYLHVPFCSVRCGYCDFNTYTAAELGGGMSRDTYMDSVLRELALIPDRRIDTVFVGGGTPTELPAASLVSFLQTIGDRLAPDAEITFEANPDSVTPESLQELRDGGFTRISLGMQSAVGHVLNVLDRTHDPARVPLAVEWARAAGFEQVSLDLIYGSPGESMDDWRHSVESALALNPDHISAYALIVEEGTAFARKVRRGELQMPDDDETADKYLLVDDLCEQAGLSWYELSNWSTSTATRCEHNRGYWYGAPWWGIGPGAHSFDGSRRWWNVKHPAAWSERLNTGVAPTADEETLSEADAALEDVMLRIRLREGMEAAGLSHVEELVESGHLQFAEGIITLTRTGRLMADWVVRQLTDGW